MHTRKLTWKDKNVCKYGTSFRACTWLPSLYRWVPCCACHEDEENRPTSSSALFYIKTIKDKIWEYIKGEILYTWLSQQNFRSLKLNLKCGTWSCEYDIHYSGQNSILHVKKKSTYYTFIYQNILHPFNSKTFWGWRNPETLHFSEIIKDVGVATITWRT